ncbi:MAG: acyltransferase, partial [Prochlorothrix sp.]
MTLLSSLLLWFPALVVGLAIACFLWICHHPSLWNVLALLFVLYGLPLLTYRVHQFFYPIPLGASYFREKEYNPWWGGNQIQLIYTTLPALEQVLHFVPGLFSQWLRLWGAKVGKGVYWSPTVSILDRGLLEVGNGAIFGHLSITCSHVVKPRRSNQLMLYVKPVKVEDHAFIGAGANLGPGSTVRAGAVTAYRQVVWVGEVYPAPSQSKSPISANPAAANTETTNTGAADPGTTDPGTTDPGT